jgi:hypothetical protein
MIPESNPQAPKTDAHLVTTAFARLVQATRLLLHDISIGRTNSSYFNDVHELLGTVPLGTEEHSLSVRRLRNAMQYAARSEAGAACYELNMLMRSFSTRSQLQIIE